MKKIALIGLTTAMLGACSLLPQQNVTGTYAGELPCADCEKIQAQLTLNADKTYQYDTVYFKDKKEYAYRDKGTYSWEPNKKNVLRLEKASGNLAFLVTEQYVEICDSNGNTVKSDNNYKLDKIR
ncbi:copper resistance protein NlpE [Mannheimia sp. AT1]|uniref:Copper resistance protein NlpE n=1 Tax=Mannheimia cairinae TaxID=3025936 RepID=A0ABT5MN73_9PAST|nr:copper resistance protein NlpE [Mannheimia cairinae]MDD0823635.1 copper resistance protein NlpE [Mannheimia cairinae]MDD0825433.1 copper resistance protein NlpE [Mannheimia cairinae]